MRIRSRCGVEVEGIASRMMTGKFLPQSRKGEVDHGEEFCLRNFT